MLHLQDFSQRLTAGKCLSGPALPLCLRHISAISVETSPDAVSTLFLVRGCAAGAEETLLPAYLSSLSEQSRWCVASVSWASFGRSSVGISSGAQLESSLFGVFSGAGFSAESGGSDSGLHCSLFTLKPVSPAGFQQLLQHLSSWLSHPARGNIHQCNVWLSAAPAVGQWWWGDGSSTPDSWSPFLRSWPVQLWMMSCLSSQILNNSLMN